MQGRKGAQAAVTTKNEFALVTVCDVHQQKGQVAVLALEGSGKKSGFAHDWPDDYPCLPNVAFLTRIKLLAWGLTGRTSSSAAAS